MLKPKYRLVENRGINVAILNNEKILLVKRISLPFIIHPGLWAFVSGAKKRNESYLETAFREVEEETCIKRQELKILLNGKSITIKDARRGTKWTNRFFVFGSKGRNIHLNMENTAYKWVSFRELKAEHNITLNYFSNKDAILKSIKACLPE